MASATSEEILTVVIVYLVRVLRAEYMLVLVKGQVAIKVEKRALEIMEAVFEELVSMEVCWAQVEVWGE